MIKRGLGGGGGLIISVVTPYIGCYCCVLGVIYIRGRDMETV